MADEPNGARKLRFPYLSSVAGAIDKLNFEAEADAKKLIEQDIPAAGAKRRVVMAKARQKIQDHVDNAVALSEELDALDGRLGDNSGDRPTSGE